jgi:uncharacterized protein (DUF934 family)
MTRQIIKNREIVEDCWQHLADGDSLPDTSADIIVTVERWRKDRDALLARDGQLGITIGGGIHVDEIVDDLEHFDLVAVRFPEFRDGRGYTYARLLRERLGFKGEIRAVGNVLRDQLFYMERCGINAFEVQEDRDIHDALNAFREFTVRYQPAADGPATPAPY